MTPSLLQGVKCVAHSGAAPGEHRPGGGRTRPSLWAGGLGGPAGPRRLTDKGAGGQKAIPSRGYVAT